MTFTKALRFFVPVLVLGTAAQASTVFNFDNDNVGTSTTFTNTEQGLSATFSSSADPGGFVVYPTIFETLTGNVLGDPGPAGMDGLDLDVSFSQNLSGITLDFATDDFATPTPLTVTAYEGKTLVGSDTSSGEYLPGYEFPEGEIAFEGGTFNDVVLSAGATDFVVDNITVLNAAPAPEPGTFLLLGTVLMGLGAMRKTSRS
jgi:hypothetical protein